MVLKGFQAQDVVRNVALPLPLFTAWLEGRQPILSSPDMACLQSVLGVKHGRLMAHKRHFFDLLSHRIVKEALLTLNAFFPSSIMSQIVGPSPAMAEGKTAIYILTRPDQDAWLVLRHKKTWLGKDLDEKDLPGVRWSRQGRDKSKIPVTLEISLQLEQTVVSEATLETICCIAARNLASLTKS